MMTDKTAHSPAPWTLEKISDSGAELYHLHDKYFRTVAYISREHLSDTDAALISAAHELKLAAYDTLIFLMQRFGTRDEEATRHIFALDTAIIKAGGHIDADVE